MRKLTAEEQAEYAQFHTNQKKPGINKITYENTKFTFLGYVAATFNLSLLFNISFFCFFF